MTTIGGLGPSPCWLCAIGGVALLHRGSAFAKIKHDRVWLKVDDSNREDFEKLGMQQYTYGKDNARKLNFFETPVDVLEDAEELVAWARESMELREAPAGASPLWAKSTTG